MSMEKLIPSSLEGPPEDRGVLTTVLRLLYNLLVITFYILRAFVFMFVPSKFLVKSVKDELVLITGAGSGIGRLMALKFAALEAKIVCWDINKDAVDETVRQIKSRGGEAFSYVCNVTDRQTVYATADRVRQDVGKVSIIVNNAGIVSGKRFLDIPDDSIQRTFDVNVLAHYWIVKAFLPEMLSSNHGHIVSIASLAGHAGLNKLTDYCGSKFAAVGFAEALALELYDEGYTGVKTTIVCPFFINTGMFDGVSCGYFPYLDADYVATSIVEGVLLDKEVVVLPKYFTPYLLLKYWVPGFVLKYLSKVLRLTDSMKTFKAQSCFKKVD